MHTRYPISLINCIGNYPITSLTLFKYKLVSIFSSIVIVVCLDNIFEHTGLTFIRCVSILDDYFDRILVRCDCTEISNIYYKIWIACLLCSMLSVFVSVYDSIDTANLIINGVLSWFPILLINPYTIFCNYFKIPLFLIAPILTCSTIILTIMSIASRLCLFSPLCDILLINLNTLPKTNKA